MEKRDNQKMIQKVARESGGTYSRGIKAKAPMHYKKKKFAWSSISMAPNSDLEKH